MGVYQVLRSLRRAASNRVALPLRAGWNRLLALTPAAPGFVGAFPDHATAMAHVPKGRLAGYDHDAVADTSFLRMCEVQSHDYPVLYWLQRHLRPGQHVLDYGGHMGTKYIAFAPYLPLDEVEWTVIDLPAIMGAAVARQAAGQVPAGIRFLSDPAAAGPADILLASGLFQYLDVPLATLFARLGQRPRVAIFNKVATREGPSVTTLERIGPARVPYQFRNRAGFEAEIAALGYRIVDRWDIPALSHVIDTHPALGPSRSLGYVLERDG